MSEPAIILLNANQDLQTGFEEGESANPVKRVWEGMGGSRVREQEILRCLRGVVAGFTGPKVEILFGAPQSVLSGDGLRAARGPWKL